MTLGYLHPRVWIRREYPQSVDPLLGCMEKDSPYGTSMCPVDGWRHCTHVVTSLRCWRACEATRRSWCMCMCVCIYINVYMWMSTCASMYVYVYVSICV